jgi:hypothetical protein
MALESTLRDARDSLDLKPLQRNTEHLWRYFYLFWDTLVNETPFWRILGINALFWDVIVPK